MLANTCKRTLLHILDMIVNCWAGHKGSGPAAQSGAGSGRAGQGLTWIHHGVTTEEAIGQRDVECCNSPYRIQDARRVHHHALLAAAIHLQARQMLFQVSHSPP